MTIQEINRAYNRITGLLDQQQLKDAFVALHGLIVGVQALEYQDTLNQMQDTYILLLRYQRIGVPDPTRTDMHHFLITNAYSLADHVRNIALKDISPLAFYSKRRSLQLNPPLSYPTLYAHLSERPDSELRKQMYEKDLSTLFTCIWTSDPLTVDDALGIREILTDETLPYPIGCQIVSALWMGLQMGFDMEKLLLLFDALQVADEEIRMRALICILLTLYIYPTRTALYPKIADRLAAAHETMPGFTHAIRTIILRFILSRETEKITRKLQEEIIPEMMKLSPKINKKINLKDFSELPGDDMNPEWQNFFGENSRLGKKMEEFSELQQEGADVMHSTFVHLKSFPFFREMGNWFLPFSESHTLFGTADQKPVKEWEILDLIGTASFMCNSDKYSLYLSIQQLPESHRTMMMNQFTSQAGELMEQKRQELQSTHNKAETIIGQYVQDLYRFYKLYPGRLEFEDIFALPLALHNLPILRPYIADDESLMIIAEYYLRKNYVADALPLYEQLIANDPNNDVLYQKTGFCRQMMNDLPGALADYQHADLLHPNSKWVIRRLAGCYRSMKQPEEALAYYHRFETLEPDNLPIQLSIGHCLLELKRFEEALKYYYKVDYLDTKGNKAWRAIAWTSFLTGKFEQAANYYEKILGAQPTMHDYMNAGHTKWALFNVEEAISYYKQSVATEGGNLDKFVEQFNQDIPELQAAGIDTDEVPLMLDQLRYALENAQ